VPTTANGQPAFGQYRCDPEGGHTPWALIVLEIVDGRIATREKVRTAARALSRLEELAVEAAGDEPVDVAVAHLASAGRAAQLAEHLQERLGTGLEGREVLIGEIGAVLGAHVGPGMVAVCVACRGAADVVGREGSTTQ
jgi:fatty acid-binding protein DegV